MSKPPQKREEENDSGSDTETESEEEEDTVQNFVLIGCNCLLKYFFVGFNRKSE